MKVSDLKIDDEYIIVDSGENIQSVTKKLMSGKYQTALVMDKMTIVGAINLSLILQKIVIELFDPLKTLARDIMDKNIVRVTPDTRLLDVDSEIRRKQPSAVVVTNKHGAVVGYVSPADMMEALQKLSRQDSASLLSMHKSPIDVAMEKFDSFIENHIVKLVQSSEEWDNSVIYSILRWALSENLSAEERVSYMAAFKILLLIGFSPLTIEQIARLFFKRDTEAAEQFMSISILPLNIVRYDKNQKKYIMIGEEKNRMYDWLDKYQLSYQFDTICGHLIRNSVM